MKRTHQQLFSTAVSLLLLCLAGTAAAQFSGSIGIGGESTNNVQSLDTSAPDQLLLPAFELNYDWHLSGISKLTLTGAYTPNFYSVNPAFSFNETTIGATGIFYLTNQNSIAQEAQAKSNDISTLPHTNSHFSQFSRGELPPLVTLPFTFSSQSIEHSRQQNDDAQSKNDSLVNIAVSALYTLSGELDSTDIVTKGVSKARVSELEDLRDSISDVLSSIGDLLDSIGYSESSAEIMHAELQHLKPRLQELMPLTKPFHTDPKLLDAAITALDEAKPISDFLSASATPSTPSSTSEEKKKIIGQLSNVEGSAVSGEEAEAPPAPTLTLVTSSERLRDFGYNEVLVHEDVDDSGATTLATSLTVPISYTSHTATSYTPADSLLFGANYGGNPNDTKTFAFSAALEGLPSTNFSLRGSYDYTRTTNPFDSVNTNTENRFRLISRFEPGKSTVLFGEASVGFRDYLDPLQVSVVSTVKTGKNKGRQDTTTTVVGSKFSQFSYGLGVSQFIGERFVAGGLIAFNKNPNLRAYVTTAQIFQVGKSKLVRAAVQIADDEYTYNLSRFTIFSVARIFADLDFGADFSYEDRTYGSATGPRGGVLQPGRTEAARFYNISLSKLIPIENRLAGIFNAALLQAKLELSDVSSSDPQHLYSYQASVFTISANLLF